HGQTGTVDHAADVAVEFYVVEIEFRGLDLKRLFLVEIAQLQVFFVTIESVVIEVDLSIEGNQTIVLGQQEGIDLDKRGVDLVVGVIQSEHELCRLIDEFAWKPKTERKLPCLERPQANRRIDGLFENNIGRFGRDLFDIHPACGGGHEYVSSGHTVERDPKIKLFVDRQTFFDQQSLDLTSLGAGLMRHEHHAEHLRGDLFCLCRRLGKLYTAAFTAAAGMDLGLNNNDICAELSRGCFSLVRRSGDNAARNRNAVLFQNGFTLIFVDLHKLVYRRQLVCRKTCAPGRLTVCLTRIQKSKGAREGTLSTTEIRS